MKNLVVMLLITLVTLKMSAQESQVMVPLEAQVKHSNIIVEGKVLSISSYVDSTDGHIYTTNTIEVYKSFKGTPDALINITTRGGVVGLEAEIISSSTKLIVGDIGIFMVNKIENKMEIYSASQGFYKYDLVDNTTTPKEFQIVSDKGIQDQIVAYIDNVYYVNSMNDYVQYPNITGLYGSA